MAYTFSFGGDEGDRTPDLLNAIQALSQLSYAPKSFTCDIIRKKTSFVNTFLSDTKIHPKPHKICVVIVMPGKTLTRIHVIFS